VEAALGFVHRASAVSAVRRSAWRVCGSEPIAGSDATALGRHWNVNITIARIDRVRRVIDLTTRLPFGITVHNHITCVPLEPATMPREFRLRVFVLA
jgi:hypothetical protein